MMKKIASTIFGCCIIFALIGITPVHAEEFSCDNVTEIPQSECEALVDFYYSTNGDNWWINDNWLVTNTPSEWFGIGIYNGHVHILYLDYTNLSGTLPLSLNNLTDLDIFKFDGNPFLTGSIPMNFISIDFVEITFRETSVCEPTNTGFIKWKNGVFLYKGSGINCPDKGK